MKLQNLDYPLGSNPSQPPLIPARGMLVGTPQRCCDPSSNRGGACFALPLLRGSWRGFCSSGFYRLITALILACISINTAQATNLGRLFFTPEQRAQLDYSYARNAPVGGNSSPVLTVNGIVQKNGGARTVWVNGVSQDAGHSSERTPSAQTVTIPGKSRPVKIKVGDRILLDQSAPPGQPAPAE